MNNIDELVKALRICNKPKGHRCSECPVFSRYPNRVCKSMVDKQSADAIEALQAELQRICKVADNYSQTILVQHDKITALTAERDALLKAVEKPCVQERGD